MHIAEKESKGIGSLAQRSMRIQVNIQDSDVMVSVDGSIIYLNPLEWKSRHTS